MKPNAPLPSHLRLIVHALLASAALAASALHAQGLEATFNTAADIPVTAPSYTASGTATFTLGFAPTPGTNLTVVKNTGLPFIEGQFTNLPNGGTVTLSYAGTTYPFIAWYYGGQGNNDLVLLWPFTGLAAWGDNSTRQLGDTSTTNRLVPVDVVLAGALQGKTLVQVSRGSGHNLALCSDGTVATWGSTGLVPVAVNVPAGTSALAGKAVVAVAASASHSMALCSDGTVATWGNNNKGQLGDNSTTSRSMPVAVNTQAGTSALAGKRVVAISAGLSHNLALCDDGMVVAWGHNQFGHLGNNSTTQSNVPVVVNAVAGTSALAGKTVVSVAAGVDHNLALCSDGSLATWGYGIVGQLGTISPSTSTVPVAVNITAGNAVLAGKTVVSIAAGHSHNLALCSDGTVAAWGGNYSGPVGDGGTSDRPVPVAVSVRAGFSALNGKTVSAISAGVFHSMALCSDGTMAAWGANSYGQLGNNGTTNRTYSVAVNQVEGTSVLAGRQIYGLSHGSTTNHSMVIYGKGTQPMVTLSTAALAHTATMLTITGIGFDDATPGNNMVAFTPTGTGTVTASTPTSLTVTGLNGLSLGALNAVVTTNGQSSAGQVATVVIIPTVTENITPLSSIATTLTITGTGFDASTPGNNTVAFSPAGTGIVTASTATTLTVSIAGLTPGALNAVVTTNGQSSGAPVQVAEVFIAPPVVTPNTAVLPIYANTVTIHGTGFDAGTPGNNMVAFTPVGTGTVTSATATSVTVSIAGHTVGPLYAVIATNGQSSGAPVQVATVSEFAAAFNSPTDIPVTAPSYTASGTATLTIGFAPLPGTNLTVIKNTGLPFIDGQFTNLPNGGTITLTHNGIIYPFVAWYYGGEGNNDLVLLWPHTGLASWGTNYAGQLGNNRTTQRNAPVNVEQSGVLASKTVVQVARGSTHSLALCSDGTITSWGDNLYGQLGNNSRNFSTVPVAVNIAAGISALAGKTVVSVAAGPNYSLALCSDGTVAAWGYNYYGQLGRGSYPILEQVPAAVDTSIEYSALAGKKVVAIAAGGEHALALCSDGTVVAWGKGYEGQLGAGHLIQSSVPVATKVTAGASALAGKTVIAVAAGAEHSLALCSDGTVSAWGYNYYGQLGDDSAVDSEAPTAVNTQPGTSSLFGKAVVGIAAGGNHSLALCSDGTVAAWGQNNSRQLGDDSAVNRQVPVAVNVAPGTSALAGKTVSAVAAGQYHSLALCSDGTMVAWGANATGQLGDNSTATHRPAPVAVNVAAGTSVLAGRLVSALSLSSAAEHSIVIYGNAATPSVTPSLTLAQNITFAPPASVYLGQSPLSLSAYASSGRTVTLSVAPVGTTAAGASIVGNALSFMGAGTVKVQAVQAGGGNYAAAPTVLKTITVRANPTTLILLNLTQTYTGTPREISTLGGSGSVAVKYKIGTAFGSTAPTNAGSYPVQATDSKGTRTGTLVIAKAPLYVIPADQRKFVGQDNPPLTLIYTGWLNGDTANLVTRSPVLRTTATKTSPGGVYPITASGGVAPANYAFIFQQGAFVVDSFAGSYETLITEGSAGGPIGKLAITLPASNSSFTGKLSLKDEKLALSLNGAVVTRPSIGSATGNATVTSGGISYIVNITALINGTLFANITRQNVAYNSATGRRLLAGKTVPYGGAHTAVLEPATPSANTLPKGAGWATAAISTNGMMNLVGRLADGTSFTASLSPDDASDPTYRLFIQPYKTGSATRLQSYLCGAFTLLPHPMLAGRRYVESAALSWAKAGLTTDTSFGPVSTVMMLDPWLPPATGFPLTTRLGLNNSSFQVLNSDTGSTLNGNLPTRVGLSATSAVSVTNPAANSTKWKVTLVPTTGTFTGSFELADTTPKPRVVPFSGVLRQPATGPDTLIGGGHYLLPPLTGTGTTSGEVMFKRP
jgi:alpha-tubulin suppressor-like RCC1 family protein